MVYSYLARNIVFPFGDFLKGTNIMKLYKFAKKSQYWKRDDLIRFQNKKFRELIKEVYNNVPYYHEYFKKNNLKIDDFKTREDIRKLPFLTKDIIRKEWNRKLLNKNHPKKLISGHTSGSSGVPMVFYEDNRSDSWSWGCKFRCFEWTGYKMGQKYVSLWKRFATGERGDNLPEPIKNFVRRHFVIDPFSIDRSNIDRWVRKMVSYKPKMIRAYVSSAYVFAKYMLEQDIVMKKQLKGVIVSGEQLYDHQRKVIEEAFNTKVFNDYGSGEVHTLAFECEEHEGLHVSMENCILEILNKNNEVVDEGEKGRIVVTGLHHYTNPFIRYEIDDVAISGDRNCSCGRGLEMIKSVEGRIMDRVITPEGKELIFQYFTNLFAEIPNVEEFQIVQNKIDKVIINIVKTRTYSDSDEKRIYSELRDFVGPSLNIELNYVDEIKKGKTGKKHYIISKVNPN
jgi:phenylacetate-CoA ligase